MSHKTNKEKYQEIRKEAKKFYQEFHNIANNDNVNNLELKLKEYFPYLILETFLEEGFSNEADKIFLDEDKQYGIDGFYINQDDETINICKFEPTDSPSDNIADKIWFDNFINFEKLLLEYSKEDSAIDNEFELFSPG